MMKKHNIVFVVVLWKSRSQPEEQIIFLLTCKGIAVYCRLIWMQPLEWEGFMEDSRSKQKKSGEVRNVRDGRQKRRREEKQKRNVCGRRKRQEKEKRKNGNVC